MEQPEPMEYPLAEERIPDEILPDSVRPAGKELSTLGVLLQSPTFSLVNPPDAKARAGEWRLRKSERITSTQPMTLEIDGVETRGVVSVQLPRNIKDKRLTYTGETTSYAPITVPGLVTVTHVVNHLAQRMMWFGESQGPFTRMRLRHDHSLYAADSAELEKLGVTLDAAADAERLAIGRRLEQIAYKLWDGQLLAHTNDDQLSEVPIQYWPLSDEAMRETVRIDIEGFRYTGKRKRVQKKHAVGLVFEDGSTTEPTYTTLTIIPNLTTVVGSRALSDWFTDKTGMRVIQGFSTVQEHVSAPRAWAYQAGAIAELHTDARTEIADIEILALDAHIPFELKKQLRTPSGIVENAKRGVRVNMEYVGTNIPASTMSVARSA